MKIKMTACCQEKIGNQLVILDVNRIFDFEKQDVERLISHNKAILIEDRATDSIKESVAPSFENKVINVVYKKRGRPRKEG